LRASAATARDNRVGTKNIGDCCRPETLPSSELVVAAAVVVLGFVKGLFPGREKKA
jgi:hypothetical protein